MNELDSLKKFCVSDGKVCPMPLFWAELHKDMSLKVKDLKVPPHLILAAWDCSEDEKKTRLAQQLQFASDNNILDLVSNFLRGLRQDQWFYTET